jgi:hypothetical protein
MRDYGLLLTTREEAEKNGYLPVMDFVRDVTCEKDDLNQILNRKIDVKYDNIRIDELLANLLEPAGIQYDINGKNIRKTMSSVTLDSKGVSIGSVLQTLEDKYEGVQFVIVDESINLTDRNYAQKRGWQPLREYLRQSKPIQQEKNEKSNPEKIMSVPSKLQTPTRNKPD